ncbi:hypothetical protein ALQ64_102515 [Pseudomonas cannabina]|uniref:Uncharacterized protein n=1 Tax=Pseudomonas cannabina TaxID=86840 RepID=A0A0P9L5E4_PSECA|nr:hypothetical protein ALO83_103732 [Pseudomonas cannabina pv. alisalensis]KPW71647.1 hypothetical protein ALO81_102265 [Pseudomonas cannabina]RMN22935.1 hypothetical protein ALQ64_102515 [Pseudomonas cannabina]RMN77032.1 hypothetical protein ALQ53_103493 [Pseudomonas cannabina]RMN83973.1 hypothetical protein ALQ52_104414 [Pseudomonas cannabina pv. alisalensis]
MACTEQADKGRACQKRTAQPLDGCLWSITGTNNHEQPSPKTDEKTNGQLSMPGWRALFRLQMGLMIPQPASEPLLSYQMDQPVPIPVARDYPVARVTTHQV